MQASPLTLPYNPRPQHIQYTICQQVRYAPVTACLVQARELRTNLHPNASSTQSLTHSLTHSLISSHTRVRRRGMPRHSHPYSSSGGEDEPGSSSIDVMTTSAATTPTSAPVSLPYPITTQPPRTPATGRPATATRNAATKGCAYAGVPRPTHPPKRQSVIGTTGALQQQEGAQPHCIHYTQPQQQPSSAGALPKRPSAPAAHVPHVSSSPSLTPPKRTSQGGQGGGGVTAVISPGNPARRSTGDSHTTSATQPPAGRQALLSRTSEPTANSPSSSPPQLTRKSSEPSPYLAGLALPPKPSPPQGPAGDADASGGGVGGGPNKSPSAKRGSCGGGGGIGLSTVIGATRCTTVRTADHLLAQQRQPPAAVGAVRQAQPVPAAAPAARRATGS